eukprot:PITA_09598
MLSLKGIEKLKPHLSQIIVQVAFAGMLIIARIVLIHGMNPFVFVTYRQIVATFAIAPFAYLLERIAITQNAYIAGLYYTSSTFAAAAFNLVPVLTFTMATFLRLENVNIRSVRGQAKIVGIVMCVGGAMVMTLYKGPALKFLSFGVKSNQVASSSKHNSILGSILVFGAVLVWSTCITFQAPVLKRYPAQLSLTALTSLIGAAESALIAVICEHKKSNFWAVGWNIELLSVLYAGIICSGLAMFLQIWCVRKKGPVFVAIFNPVNTIVTAILELVILHVYLRVGSVVGAILVVVGLYATLWGKAMDTKTEADDEPGNDIMPH